MWHEAEGERQSERALNSSRDTRTDSKPGAPDMTADLGNIILKYAFLVCALGLPGQPVTASNVSTSKIRSGALRDSLLSNQKFVQPGFS